MTDLFAVARGEATNELAHAILLAADECLRRHGPDDHGYHQDVVKIAILAAGFVRAMEAIAKIDPTLPRTVLLLLEQNGWGKPTC